MKCRKAVNLMVSSLDGDLPGRLKEEVASHLERCAACRKERDKLSGTWNALGSYSAPELRDDFVSSLMKKIHEDDAKTVRIRYRVPWFVLRPLVPVLSSVLIAVLAVAVFFERSANEKISSYPTLPPPINTASTMVEASDKEIIQNLDVLENMDLLNNINLLNELDVVMDLKESAS